ncbi:MAG: glycosyltransferase family 4 protein [bacterium]|nr:glycosyltransferase family 4 protein [bacterium]
MKLIYITNSRIPTTKAHGFQIMKMCEAFSSAGCEVELWVPRRLNPLKENPFRYYEIRETFNIKKIPTIDLIPLYRVLGTFANFVESISFAVFNIWRLNKTNFDIIYSRDQFTLWLLSFLNYKFIYEMHKMPRHPGFYRRIWRKARKIITITAVLKDAIVKEGVDASKILVVHDGVDLDAFNAVNKNAEELKTELSLPKEQFLVGYVGKFKTLEQEKGLKTMIEALSLLNKEIKMAFVGGEEAEVKEYKSLAQRFNVLSQCVFIGHQPYKRMIEYMKAMDAVVLPSPDKPLAHYSSPLKLFEYMASGRPIIVSDLPALREVLNDKNALFFKPENSDDLARAIKMLKASPTLGYHLSQQALADVKNYTWARRAKNILIAIEP